MATPDVTSFLEAELQHLHVSLSTPHFRELIPPMHVAYNAGWEAVPKGTDLLVGQLLLLCHRAFLVAVSIIARAHPDDAAGTTRRAIEVAKFAFAVCHDPENLNRWLAYKERTERWEARHQGQKPKRFAVHLNVPRPHELLDQLDSLLGIESDAAVHFTPEYINNYDFERRADHGFFSYFVTDRDHIERTLRGCVATHIIILRTFNEALKGAFQHSQPWCQAMQDIHTAGLRLHPSPAIER